MNHFRDMVGIVVILLLGQFSFAQKPQTDPARHFHKDTLAYIEVQDPKTTIAQLQPYLQPKGPTDSIKKSHDRRDRYFQSESAEKYLQVELLGLLTSPDMLISLAQCRSFQFAITELKPNGQLRWMLVIHTGDNLALRLLTRTYLTQQTNIRRIRTSGEYVIYQRMGLNVLERNEVGKPNVQLKRLATPTENQWTYVDGQLQSDVNDFVAIASDPDLIEDYLKRRTAENTNDTLLADDLFQSAQAERKKAGAFLWLHPQKWHKAMQQALPNLEPEEPLRSLYHTAEHILGWKSWQSCVGHAFTAGSPLIELKIQRQDSPPQIWPFAQSQILTQSPSWNKDWSSISQASAPASSGPQTWISLLDAWSKSQGQIGPLPSDILNELKPKQRQALLTAIQQVLSVEHYTKHSPATAPKPKLGEAPMPSVERTHTAWILNFADETTAATWLEEIPAWLQVAERTDSAKKPNQEMTQQQKVYSLTLAENSKAAALHYSQKGKWIAVSTDRTTLLNVLTQREIDVKLSTENTNEYQIVASFRWRQDHFFDPATVLRLFADDANGTMFGRYPGYRFPQGLLGGGPPMLKEVKKDEQKEPTAKEFFQQQKPVELSIATKGNQLQVRLSIPTGPDWVDKFGLALVEYLNESNE